MNRKVFCFIRKKLGQMHPADFGQSPYLKQDKPLTSANYSAGQQELASFLLGERIFSGNTRNGRKRMARQARNGALPASILN
jgi:hypothetical protein